MGCLIITTFLIVLLGVFIKLAIDKPPNKSFLCHAFDFDCPEFEITGDFHPAYYVVRQLFQQHFENGLEKAAQLVVYSNGKKVVDLVGGNRVDNIPMKQDDLAVIFSSTKVIESLIAAMLVNKGLIKYDTLIKDVWPAFGVNGKEKITFAQLMQHSAGLSALNETMTIKKLKLIGTKQFEDWLAAQPVTWEDDNVRTEYHGLTRGLFTDVIVRRLTGKSLQQMLQEEIIDVLNDDETTVDQLEFYLGNVPDKVDKERVAHHDGAGLLATFLQVMPQMIYPAIADYVHPFFRLSQNETLFFKEVLSDAASVNARSLTVLENGAQLRGAHILANSKGFRSLQLASGSGVSNARTIAAIINELAVNSGRLLSKETLIESVKSKLVFDHNLKHFYNYTNSGWAIDRLADTKLRNWVGWAGAGGSVTQFNPLLKIAFSYIPTSLAPRLKKPRGQQLMRAVVDCQAYEKNLEERLANGEKLPEFQPIGKEPKHKLKPNAAAEARQINLKVNEKQ